MNTRVLPLHFKGDGTSRRVGGENDYLYCADNNRIYQISKKVDDAFGMSSHRNCLVPSLADNTESSG